MAQTAMEWFVEQLPIRIVNMYNKEIEQAKQMEKEQSNEIHKLKAIIEFYEQGCGLEECKVIEPHVH